MTINVFLRINVHVRYNDPLEVDICDPKKYRYKVGCFFLNLNVKCTTVHEQPVICVEGKISPNAKVMQGAIENGYNKSINICQNQENSKSYMMENDLNSQLKLNVK